MRRCLFGKNNAPYFRKGHNLQMGFLFKVLPSHHIFIRNFFIRCYPRTYHLDNYIIYSIFLIVNSLVSHFSLFFCATYNIIRKNSNFSLSFLIRDLFIACFLKEPLIVYIHFYSDFVPFSYLYAVYELADYHFLPLAARSGKLVRPTFERVVISVKVFENFVFIGVFFIRLRDLLFVFR